MIAYEIWVDSGYRFEYHSVMLAVSVKEARKQFMSRYAGSSTLWNGPKSFKVKKVKLS